jgi:hypothetical protein
MFSKQSHSRKSKNKLTLLILNFDTCFHPVSAFMNKLLIFQIFPLQWIFASATALLLSKNVCHQLVNWEDVLVCCDSKSDCLCTVWDQLWGCRPGEGASPSAVHNQTRRGEQILSCNLFISFLQYNEYTMWRSRFFKINIASCPFQKSGMPAGRRFWA